MNGDLFNTNNNIFEDSTPTDGRNFFVTNNNSVLFEKQEIPRRLNDYDYNILREDAYKDVSDELFKLEYKISKLEDNIKILEGQIQSARDINDYDAVEYYSNRRRQAQEDLAGLIEIYNDKSLSSKISGGFFNIISPKIKEKLFKINKSVNDFKEVLISNLSGKYASVNELKQSLAKLENINKNVDELMTMQTPYGEDSVRYEQLSKYIVRANSIQAKIAKNLR